MAIDIFQAWRNDIDIIDQWPQCRDIAKTCELLLGIAHQIDNHAVAAFPGKLLGDLVCLAALGRYLKADG